MDTDLTPAEHGPLAGVVVPLHNKRAFITRAIESVINQTYGNWHLTVVDDGSTDGSAELVERFTDARIALIRTASYGPGAARNTGLRASNAEWVALLDADDEWDPTFLSRTATVATKEPDLVAVFARVAARDTPGFTQTEGEGRIDDYFTARLRSFVAMTSSSVLLRRVTFLGLGGFREDYRYAEDVEAWFRLVCAGPVYFIPDVLCRIETGDGSSMTRTLNVEEKVDGLTHLLDSYARQRAAGKIPARLARGCRRFMEHQSARIAVHLADAGHPMLAARRLLSSVPLGSHTWRDYMDYLRALRH